MSSEMLVVHFCLLFAVLLQIQCVGALDVRPITTPTTKRPIQRVAIIGSGVAGLTLAHALAVSPPVSGTDYAVSIFESRSQLDPSEGAGFQLNGGLAVLGKIDPRLQKSVWDAGLPLKRIQSRSKAWFGNTDEKDYTTLLHLDLKRVVDSAGEKVTSQLISPRGDLSSAEDTLLWTTVRRGTLQKTLMDQLPEATKVSYGKRISKIIPDSSDGINCVFSDGSTAGPFDLIVGCDGTRSSVKEYVDSAGIRLDLPESSLEPSNAIYSGIRIRFAVAEGRAEDPEAEPVLTQYFGDGAYALHGVFGAGPNRPKSRLVLIVYLDENYIGPFPVKDPQQRTDKVVIGENSDWRQDVSGDADVLRQNMLEQVAATHLPDKHNDLRSVIEKADRLYELGSYFHNPFTSWSRRVKDSENYVVLCGDAAHALPPFLGQGSNQAIQSAYCLAEKINEYNQRLLSGDDDLTLQSMLDEYRKERWPSTFGILWKSIFLGYLETGGGSGIFSKLRDSFFRVMFVTGVAQRVLLSAATPKISSKE